MTSKPPVPTVNRSNEVHSDSSSNAIAPSTSSTASADPQITSTSHAGDVHPKPPSRKRKIDVLPPPRKRARKIKKHFAAKMCLICLEDASTLKGEPMKITTCGHIFCAICLNRWIQRRRNCPYCRKINIHPLRKFKL